MTDPLSPRLQFHIDSFGEGMRRKIVRRERTNAGITVYVVIQMNCSNEEKDFFPPGDQR
jgi:hypothetical protein